MSGTSARGRRRICLAAAALTAALALATATPAWAGTYSIVADGQALCDLLTPISNVPGFITQCLDPTGTARIQGPPGGTVSPAEQLYEIDAPANSGLTIINAQVHNGSANIFDGYGGGTYWSGGGSSWNGQIGSGQTDSGAINSPYWGFQLLCTSTCGPWSNSAPNIGITGIDLTVQEVASPALTAVNSDNLFYQTGKWLWNPPGDGWPAELSASDPSGICFLDESINSASVGSTRSNEDRTQWQQCPSPNDLPLTIDLSALPTSAQVPFTVSAQDAAQNPGSVTVNLEVDNTAPTIKLGAINDANPGGWAVNHAVTLQVSPTTGPSGISNLACSDLVNGQTRALSIDRNDQVTIDGNGSHDVVCSVANGAVDPQGRHNLATTSEQVDIDEQAPTLVFEPTDPANPDQVVVQTADNESPVGGGTIEIAPAGSTSFTSLPTSFTSNGQLIATLPDASLSAGQYVIRATATSQVGNVGTAEQGVTLPRRVTTTEAVSFAKLAVPVLTRRIRERVRVGFHYRVRMRHGHRFEVKVGGHVRTITVVKRVRACTLKQVRTGRHSAETASTCPPATVQYQPLLTVPFGRPATVFGELTSGAGVPVAGQPVTILTAPDNGSNSFTELTTTQTNAQGGWSVTVPPGPGRIVKAVFDGNPTTLPTSSTATLQVPARIDLTVSPRHVGWNGTVTIRGQLQGGDVPVDGVAMRLLIRLPGRRQPYEPVPFRTTSSGSFELTWSWGRGTGVARYPFSVAMTASESDYPYLAAESPRISVTFGYRHRR